MCTIVYEGRFWCVHVSQSSPIFIFNFTRNNLKSRGCAHTNIRSTPVPRQCCYWTFYRRPKCSQNHINTPASPPTTQAMPFLHHSRRLRTFTLFWRRMTAKVFTLLALVTIYHGCSARALEFPDESRQANLKEWGSSKICSKTIIAVGDACQCHFIRTGVTHPFKKISFEGLIQGCENKYGPNFYLWEAACSHLSLSFPFDQTQAISVIRDIVDTCPGPPICNFFVIAKWDDCF